MQYYFVTCTDFMQFLANVNAFTFAICYRPSICRLSVVCRLSVKTLMRPTQAVEIFGNISTAFGTLAIH